MGMGMGKLVREGGGGPRKLIESIKDGPIKERINK